MFEPTPPFAADARVTFLAQELAAELIRAQHAISDLQGTAEAIEEDVAARLRFFCAVFDSDELDQLLLLLAEAVDNLGGPEDHNPPSGFVVPPGPALH